MMCLGLFSEQEADSIAIIATHNNMREVLEKEFFICLICKVLCQLRLQK